MKAGSVRGVSRRFVLRRWRGGEFSGLGLLLAIGGLASACALGPPGPPRAPAAAKASAFASAPPAPCAAEYSALLDLAELARRYGPSAGIFLEPLGDMFDQLDQCLMAAQGEAWPLHANVVEIGARGASAIPPFDAFAGSR